MLPNCILSARVRPHKFKFRMASRKGEDGGMNKPKEKLKLALYWGAGCGGCDVSIVDLDEKILNVVELADIVFWPCATDFKYRDVEAYHNGYIDFCFFFGALRNSENEHIAKLLRKKSKILVAYGSCAHLGGIPGLANFSSRKGILDTVFQETWSTYNPHNIRPQTFVEVDGFALELPEFYKDVRPLDSMVEVDYFLPGCPPSVDQIWAVIGVIASGDLPPQGSVVGASSKILCDECERKKEDKKIREFHRVHQVDKIDPDKCILEQGIICLGPVTRGGCGQRCISANMPCRGCYGPAPDVKDQGAKMLAVLGSIIDSEDPEEIKKILLQIADVSGTCYRFFAPALGIRGA